MRQAGMTNWVKAFFFVFCILMGASPAFGSGFAIYAEGASSVGQAGATIAHGEDPSVIVFNPALLNKFDGTQVELGTTLIIPSRDFKSDLTGKSSSTKSDIFFPSTFFVSHKFNDQVSAGLGVFNPFGLGTNWPDNWEGRYIATNSSLTTYDINPALSFQLTPWISIAAGLDIIILDTTLEKKLNFQSLGLPDGGEKFKGDGNGVGYSLGVLLDPHPDISIGVSYRSEVKVNVNGNTTFDLSDIPQPYRSQLSTLFPDTPGSSEISLPQRVQFGVYYKHFYPFTFEIAGRWEGWSSFDRLAVALDKPVMGSTSFVTERNWNDAWSGNIGLKYQVNDNFALLAGYLYQGNPVPDSTFDPSIPDANGHLFSVGTDMKYGPFRAGLAYAYQIMLSRNKSNAVDDNPSDGILNPATAANGEYNSQLHMIALTVTYVF